MSRTKDEKIVKESQKFFGVAKIAGLIFAVILVILTGYLFFAKEKEIAKSAPSTSVSAIDYPLCGNFDFSSLAVPADLKVNFRPDCLTAVTLPPRAIFRTDSSEDVKIVFIDGSTYLDGPGRQVWYGLKKGVFRMHGIANSGILKITIDKT